MAEPLSLPPPIMGQHSGLLRGTMRCPLFLDLAELWQLSVCLRAKERLKVWGGLAVPLGLSQGVSVPSVCGLGVLRRCVFWADGII